MAPGGDERISRAVGQGAVQGVRATDQRVVTLPRVLHVDSGRSWRGGQRQVLLLATGLHDRGYRTLVVGPAGSPLVQRAERAGLPTYRLTLRGEWDVRRARELRAVAREWHADDRKSTRLNSSHSQISYAVFCLKKKK